MNDENSTMKSQTDWEKVDELRDEDIDLSDFAEVSDEMWAKGELFVGSGPISDTTQEHLPIDKDIVEFFRSKGIDYPVRINHVLRTYIHQQKSR